MPEPETAGSPRPPAPPGQDQPIWARITERQRRLITAAVMLATVMEVIDISIVNVALPDMMGNLGATVSEIGWVSTGYIIANVIVIPLTGWLSDYFGRTRYLTYSVILFTIASFGCGSSRTLVTLVFFRVLQGMGGAAFISSAQAVLMEIYPPHRRGQGQAMFGMGVVMAPTLGPTIGGYITDHYSWPWIFFINIPLGILAATMIWSNVPDSHHAGERRGADWIGIALLTLGLGSLQTVLERGQSEEWFAEPYIVWLALVSIAGLALFIWWELHEANGNPAVNLRILHNRSLAAGSLYGFALGFFLYGAVFVLPLFLQRIQHHTAEQTGLILMPGGFATALMLPIVGRLAHKIDPRLMLGCGMALFATCVHQLANAMAPAMPDQAVYGPLIIRGVGLGLTFVPLSLATLGTLQPRELTQGAGIYGLARQLGGSFGIALLATLLEQRERFHWMRLYEAVSPYSYATTMRLEQLKAGFVARGLTPDRAQTSALTALNRTIQGQAMVKAYMDVFIFMTYLALAALLLLFLFERPKMRGAPPEAKPADTSP